MAGTVAVAAGARDATRLEPLVCFFFHFLFFITLKFVLDPRNDGRDIHGINTSTAKRVGTAIAGTVAEAAGARDMSSLEPLVYFFSFFSFSFYYTNVYSRFISHIRKMINFLRCLFDLMVIQCGGCR